MSLRQRFKNRFSAQEDRGTLVVSRRSWHGRLYHFWREYAAFKNTSSYRENLCHYVRVILFWGPISLFIFASPKKREYITPLSVTVTVATIALIAYAIVTEPFGTLMTFLAGLGFVAAVAVLFFLFAYIENHKYEIRAWWFRDGLGARQLKAVGRFLKAVISAPFRLLGYKVFGIPYVAYVAVGAVVAGSFYDIVVLLYALAAVGLAALVFMAAWGLDILVEWIRMQDWRPQREYKQKDEGIFKVGARFAVAKKGKICPFIEVQ